MLMLYSFDIFQQKSVVKYYAKKYKNTRTLGNPKTVYKMSLTLPHVDGPFVYYTS